MSESENQAASVPASPKPASASYLSSPAISAPPSLLQSPSLSRSPLFLTPQHPRTTTKSITRHEKTYSHSPQVFSAPVSQLHSTSMSRSPFLETPDRPVTMPASGPQTPLAYITSRNLTPKFLTPLASPLRKALRLTKLDPHDAWLPITESRNGNSFYAAFHTLCSGIGFEALILPVAFTFLGWAWGIISLVCAFIWQFYTLFLLINLHESAETGIRYSRYGQLATAAFGERLGNFLTKFPIIYLSAGTCVALIITGGSTSRVFFQIMCDSSCKADTLTATEWYLVFTCAIVLLSQLPNMNSIAGISLCYELSNTLVGAITAIGYCTTLWIASVAEDRLSNVSYDPIKAKSDVSKVFNNFNALGIVVFAFKGHNLTLEIQATMPSNEKHPSTIPMLKGVRASYTLIAMCVFPLSIGGYWAYGNLIPSTGMLAALLMFHAQDLAKSIKGLACLLVIINSLTSYQIYAMPTFDEMESIYVVRFTKACPWWLRVVIRSSFGFVSFLFAVAFPFLDAVAGLVGGIALPVTLAYPCFMWLKIKKPQVYSLEWWLNWGLGVFGMGLSVLVVIGGVYSIIDSGVKLKFFKPQ